MKKRKNNHRFALILTIAILLGLVLLSFLIVKSSKQSNYIGLQDQKELDTTFQSETLNFTVDVPADFESDEASTTVTFKNNIGEIVLSRNSTNYEDLDSYVTDFDSKRNLTASSSVYETVDGKDVLSRIITLPEQGIRQKSFYIYSDYFVYTISTDSEELFDDLDVIARSFRYTP